MFKFFKKKKQPYYVISICKTANLNTKYGEYPCKFENKNEARQLILSYHLGWGEEILRQEENYKNKPADAWRVKNRWLIIEEKMLDK